MPILLASMLLPVCVCGYGFIRDKFIAVHGEMINVRNATLFKCMSHISISLHNAISIIPFCLFNNKILLTSLS